MSAVAKYLPTILAIIAAAMPSLSVDAANAIGVFVSHNVTLSSWLVAIVWVLYHLLPSPIQAQITGSAMPKV